MLVLLAWVCIAIIVYNEPKNKRLKLFGAFIRDLYITENYVFLEDPISVIFDPKGTDPICW